MRAEYTEIEARFSALFSDQPLRLDAAIAQLEQLAASPMIHAFLTPISWQVQGVGGEELRGDNQNLLGAVTTILGTLQQQASLPGNDDAMFRFSAGAARYTTRENQRPAAGQNERSA